MTMETVIFGGGRWEVELLELAVLYKMSIIYQVLIISLL